MTRPWRLWALLVLVLALSGCGVLRTLVGPDPALVAAKPTIDRALGEHAANHPDLKFEDDKAREAVGGATQHGPDGLGWFQLLLSLATPVNVTSGAAAVAALLAWLKGRKTAAVVDQHAELIDSVTPEKAEFAARTKKAKKVTTDVATD